MALYLDLYTAFQEFSVFHWKPFFLETEPLPSTEHPETEEELISKLDSMDKEIVECEEDIKNLDTMQVNGLAK